MDDQKAIWEGIRSGDRQVFEDFYRAHAGGILQFLCRMTRNRQASEEMTQEVFLGLWKRPNGFDPGRGNLINYVYGIARNRGSDWWRRHAGSDQDSPDSLEKVSTGDTLTGILLQDAFSKLNIEDRSLLWLREIEGHSYAELANTFGVPIGTIRSRLFSAREELRRLWKTD